MITPLFEEYNVPSELKGLINQIVSINVISNGETIVDKYIPHCDGSWVLHFKQTFKFSVRNRHPSMLPLTFFTGSFNQQILLESIGDLESIVITMKPYALFRIFNLKMTDLSRNYFLDALPVIGQSIYNEIRNRPDTEQRVIKVLDYIQSQLYTNKSATHIVDALYDEMLEKNGVIKISELGQKYKINERYIRRFFLQRIGLPAKQLAKTARVSFIIKSLPVSSKPEWLNMVSECGYVDQSHFIREFKMVTGESPTCFFKRDRRYLNIISYLES